MSMGFSESRAAVIVHTVDALEFMEQEQMSYVVTNSLTDFHICGHQKSLEISSMVLLKPKCPADGKSC